MPRIIPNLWFDTESEEAAAHYCRIFPNSEITLVTHYGPDAPREEGMVMTVDFTLDGNPVTAINGGPDFPFSEAVSLLIECEDQAEIDHYWAELSDGGEEGPCGWLKDRFGLSWQICPKGMDELLGGEDRERAARAMQAMLSMGKLDLAALRAA